MRARQRLGVRVVAAVATLASGFAVAFGALAGTAPAASADPPADPECGYHQSGTAYTSTCDGDVPGSGAVSTHGTPSGSQSTWTPPTEWTQTHYVPTCDVNDAEGGADALCGASVNTCPDPDIRFWVYIRTVYADPNKPPTDWKQQDGSVCRGPDEPTQEKPKVTPQQVVDAARGLAPKPSFVVQPADGSYVNVPNNFYATAPDTTQTINLFGTTIAVHFTGAKLAWHFGDGSSAMGNGIKDAALHQAGAVEHAYLAQGTYDISVTSTYHISFDLFGQHIDNDIEGQPSDPVSLQVREIQTLVTDAR